MLYLLLFYFSVEYTISGDQCSISTQHSSFSHHYLRRSLPTIASLPTSEVYFLLYFSINRKRKQTVGYYGKVCIRSDWSLFLTRISRSNLTACLL